MQKITPFLWFDNQAEEAANLYVSLLPNSRILGVWRFPEGAPGPDGAPGPGGQVMTVQFELDGQQFTALNGGPLYKFTEAISLMVNCESQEEIDRLWDALIADGGEPSQCGWLKDKFGLSWQITPTVLGEMLAGGDPERSRRVVEAFMPMQKLDIATLQAAYEGK